MNPAPKPHLTVEEVESLAKDWIFLTCMNLFGHDEAELEDRRTENPAGLHFMLRVPYEDLGKILGKKGRTVQALRLCVTAFGRDQGCRFSLEVTSAPPVIQ